MRYGLMGVLVVLCNLKKINTHFLRSRIFIFVLGIEKLSSRLEHNDLLSGWCSSIQHHIAFSFTRPAILLHVNGSSTDPKKNGVGMSQHFLLLLSSELVFTNLFE